MSFRSVTHIITPMILSFFFTGCANRECTSDSDCEFYQKCNRNTWTCEEECKPYCENICCGSDGCFSQCPSSCPAGYYCNIETCYCEENCLSDEDCQIGTCCVEGACRRPNCENRDCGPDGCGGTCGECNQVTHCCNEQYGKCMSINEDVKNCGGCGIVCSFDHAWTSCQDGGCVMGQCEHNWGDCNNDSVDGCEINLMMDHSNCGVCDNACLAGESCVDGVCQ